MSFANFLRMYMNFLYRQYNLKYNLICKEINGQIAPRKSIVMELLFVVMGSLDDIQTACYDLKLINLFYMLHKLTMLMIISLFRVKIIKFIY